MRSLTLVSGVAWPLSPRARQWLAREPGYVRLAFLTPGSDETRRLVPGLPKGAGEADLAAVSDDGRVWRGASAWVMTLWALRAHRRTALELVRTNRTSESRRVIEALARGCWSVPARPLAPVSDTTAGEDR